MSKQFLDTNVIVYANDDRDPLKHDRAIELVTHVIRQRNGVVSTQVLQEYASVAGSKLRQDLDVVQRQLLFLEALEIVPVTPALIRRALELQLRYQINFWDASILAAAELAQCRVLFSEDLNPGQLYANVRIENPFAPSG
jgi:predicted nucleic acid-binding protein